MKNNILNFIKPDKNIEQIKSIIDDFEYLMDTYNYREYLICLPDNLPCFGDSESHRKIIDDVLGCCLNTIFKSMAYTSKMQPDKDISYVIEDMLEDVFYILNCVKHLYFIMEKYSQMVNEASDLGVKWDDLEQNNNYCKFYDKSFEEKLWFCFEKDVKDDKERLMFTGNEYSGCNELEGYIFRLVGLLIKISSTIGYLNLAYHNVDGSVSLRDLSVDVEYCKGLALKNISMKVKQSIVDENKELDYQDILSIYYTILQ